MIALCLVICLLVPIQSFAYELQMRWDLADKITSDISTTVEMFNKKSNAWEVKCQVDSGATTCKFDLLEEDYPKGNVYYFRARTKRGEEYSEYSRILYGFIERHKTIKFGGRSLVHGSKQNRYW